MPFTKGNNANPAGKNQHTNGKGVDFKALCVKETPNSFRRLKAIAKDGKVAAATRAGVDQYIIDRAHGRPEAAQSTAQGMFQGATIIVDTGIRRRALESPVIDETGLPATGGANGQDRDTPDKD